MAAFAPMSICLICHTDAFVFRDELEKWCNRGYDYIASHIYNTFWEGESLPIRSILDLPDPSTMATGGLRSNGLRHFIASLPDLNYTSNFFHWTRRIRNRGFLDDIFVAQLFPNLSSKFSVAPKSLAQ